MKSTIKDRVIAYLIDSLVLGGSIVILLVAAQLCFGGDNFAEQRQRAGSTLGLAPCALATYDVVCLTLFGQTLGKRVMQLKVVARNGSAVTLRHALLRNVAAITSATIPLFLGLVHILGSNRLRATPPRPSA